MKTMGMFLLSAVLFRLGASGAPGLRLAVDPLRGDDAAAGSDAAPLKTPAAARDRVRRLKMGAGLPPGGVEVTLRGGRYFLREASFTLDVRDSGAPGRPVVWRSAPGAGAVLTGAVRADPALFRPVTDPAALSRLPAAARARVRVCRLRDAGISDVPPIPKTGFGWPAKLPPQAVLVNGKRLRLARFPDSGFLRHGKILAPGYKPRDNIGKPVSFFLKQPGPAWACKDPGLLALAAPLAREPDVWTYGYFAYAYADDNVAVFPPEKTGDGLVFTGRHPTWYSALDKARGGVGIRFYLYNILCGLDRPGEFYIDRAAGRLYLYPEAGLEGAAIELPVLNAPMMALSGASHLRIEGLRFEKGNDCAIALENCSDVTVGGCVFTQLGQQAVRVNGGARVEVRGCDFTHIGAGGVVLRGGDKLSLTPAGHRVDNCYFEDFSMIRRTYTPAVSLGGVGNSATRNVITRAPHQAVAFGGNCHVISGNDISRVCSETGDSGAIYSGRSWISYGTVIENNHIHDMASNAGGGSAGVYLDDMLGGITVSRNLFRNLPGRAFLIGGGRDNTIENNIGANNGGGTFIQYDNRGRNWAHAAAHIPGGACYEGWKKFVAKLRLPENAAHYAKWRKRFPAMFAPAYGKAARCGRCKANRSEGSIPANAVIRNNIAAGVRNPYGAINGEVKKHGAVSGNVSRPAGADIGFAAPGKGDFRVRAGSEIEKVQGEAHFRQEKTGLYADEYRPGGRAPLAGNRDTSGCAATRPAAAL